MKRALEGAAALALAAAAHGYALQVLTIEAEPNAPPDQAVRQVAMATPRMAAAAESWEQNPGSATAPALLSAVRPPQPPALEARSDTPPKRPAPSSPAALNAPVQAAAEPPRIDVTPDAPPQPPEPEAQAPDIAPDLSPPDAPIPVRRPTRPEPAFVELAPLPQETVVLEHQSPAPIVEPFVQPLAAPAAQPPIEIVTPQPVFQPIQPNPPPRPEPPRGEVVTVEEFFAERAPSPASAPAAMQAAPAPAQGAAPAPSSQHALPGPSRAATQPTRRLLVPAQPAAAPSGPDPAAIAAARGRYGDILTALIEARKVYPRRAKRRRREGIATVQFMLDRSGRVVSASIVESARANSLDEAALDLIRNRIGQFPPPPLEIADGPLTFTVPISYELR